MTVSNTLFEDFFFLNQITPRVKDSDLFVTEKKRYINIPCLKATLLPPLNFPECIELNLLERFSLPANKVSLGGHSAICTQYPREKDTLDFWIEAFTNDRIIVDLTEPMEPQPNELLLTSGFKGIDAANKTWTTAYQYSYALAPAMNLCVYSVSNETFEKRIIRIHFSAWKENAALEPATFMYLTQRLYKAYTTNCLMIHSMAGVGRTGCLLTALAILHLFRKNQLAKDSYKENINNLILEGRRQRGPLFVSTPPQYESIRKLARMLLQLEDSLPQEVIPLPNFFINFSEDGAEKELYQRRIAPGGWIARYDLRSRQYVLSYVDENKVVQHKPLTKVMPTYTEATLSAKVQLMLGPNDLGNYRCCSRVIINF